MKCQHRLTHLTPAGDEAYRVGCGHGAWGRPASSPFRDRWLREAYLHGYAAGRKQFEDRRRTRELLNSNRGFRG